MGMVVQEDIVEGRQLKGTVTKLEDRVAEWQLAEDNTLRFVPEDMGMVAQLLRDTVIDIVVWQGMPKPEGTATMAGIAG
eukprot:CAMPEP_0202977898 /NCGR_PEP_ID=MMETSP1396-20130829/84520_1 /ASSEMBLY_ACC=CAM_ASM_000872 /TAXON_ID= /ORGANISM="Pseudokeronopsis sp., Strain Brazil" /LENGTH=78 /DNA_ID=CAMNT_0049716727 /DNA_START=874 /DNA_END=1107 /DNA_ORIENTATION=+